MKLILSERDEVSLTKVQCLIVEVLYSLFLSVEWIWYESNCEYNTIRRQ